MFVKIYDYDNEGNETFRTRCDLRECGLEDTGSAFDEYPKALYELCTVGRYWTGGGAAPLVLLMNDDR